MRAGDVTVREIHAAAATASDAATLSGAASASPLMSVVIPCYNHAQFLADAIESVRGQTHDRVETIVVDDGSTDETAVVAARYPDVRYVRQENQGLAGARNTGLRHARGDYLVFLDADDRLLPDALAAGLACLAVHPHAVFTSGHYRYVKRDGSLKVYPPLPMDDDDSYRAFLRKNYILMHATVMYRREPLERVGGFDPALRACEDYDLYLRMSREFPVCRHDTIVAEYRRHGANMSRDATMMLDAVLAVLDKQVVHVRGDRARSAAIRIGRRRWRELYDEKLLEQLRAEPRRLRNPRAALRGAMAMMRFGLKLAARRFGARVRQVAYYLQRRLTAPRVGHVNLGDLRRVTPISTCFGYDRGRPVDRYYIERFLAAQAHDVRGRVLEIGDNAYTLRFGGDRVTASDVLHVQAGNPRATFVGDLANANHLPSDAFDCVVLTQTLHIIYDVRAALATLRRVLKAGGVLLATFPGISHVDQGEWGGTWSWGFTLYSARRLFEEFFPPAALTMETHGNVLAAIAFLHGLAVEDLRTDELDHRDPHYQVVITVRAVKPSAADEPASA